MIREAIGIIVEGRSLTREEAAAAMNDMMSGEATPAQIGAFITALRMKGETPEEIAGMAQVMRERSLRVETEGPLVDTCGTGGDASHSLNVSTTAAFVVAGAGVRVAKHGNRSFSSSCGSADVLEAQGVKIDLGPQGVKRCLEEVGIGFMFAPVFHPAMKHAAVPRREIGIRTVFNVVGPLANPAGAQAQVLGIADPSLGEKMVQVLRLLGSVHALVVHGHEGLDEIALSGPTRLWELKDGAIDSFTFRPEDVGLNPASLDAIKGGSVERNAALMTGVLQGQEGPALDVVLLNAAAALVVGGKADTIREGLPLARESVASEAALAKLKTLAHLSQELEKNPPEKSR